MKTIKIYNIIWDTEDKIEDEIVDLPCEVIAEFEDNYDEDTLVKYLRDTYGWCVYEYEYEEIDK